MKWILLGLLSVCLSATALAQDVDYKKGIISVDGKEYAKVEVKKINFGLTKNFEVFSMNDRKLIIATVATEYEQPKSDNSFLYYRLTFLTSNQVGIFKISSLSQEKSFAKLIGNSGIMEGDSTNDQKVKEFIAAKSASPTIAVDYTLVNRDKRWPLSLQKDHTFEQNGKTIGSFKNLGSQNELDFYEFMLPSGVIIAKISFTGGNNMQNMELFTAKDNLKRVIPMKTNDKLIIADASIDKNQFALKRIAQWLIEHDYL
jgi:hypothetical protein